MVSVTFDDLANMSEVVVGDYLKKRGFAVEKLDEEQDPYNSSACDWLVKSPTTSFLCEVKTITSVQRGINTQGDFRKLENQIHDYFSRTSSVQNLPYHLHFHSDILSLPGDAELYRFLKGVSRELKRIHAKGLQLNFLMFADLDSHTSLHITQSLSRKLEVEISTYGGLNVEAIRDRVGQAVSQLKNTCKDHPTLTRLVILYFASQIYITNTSEVVVFDGLEFKGNYLWECIGDLLRQYSSLSAIAVMSDQANPSFMVYHNLVVSVEPLSRSVFDDGISVQFDSLDGVPRATIKKLERPDGLLAMILSNNFENQDRKILTVADYEQLRKMRN